jgi:hypothetical protein
MHKSLKNRALGYFVVLRTFRLFMRFSKESQFSKTHCQEQNRLPASKNMKKPAWLP